MRSGHKQASTLGYGNRSALEHRWVDVWRMCLGGERGREDRKSLFYNSTSKYSFLGGLRWMLTK